MARPLTNRLPALHDFSIAPRQVAALNNRHVMAIDDFVLVGTVSGAVGVSDGV
jgi:hypothetical protein